jgi:DNA-directed RNA polymerase subunit E"
MKELACRRCKAITTGKICPICKSTDLSADWYGLVVIVSEESQVAKMLNIKHRGKYALKVT